ncbi:Mitosis initiation protein fs(1)Ya [Eumeta japonica]|uniref:Mitosis initiation protein fs(1)Ya n=1 Tax=Eumeta variegata TaxID=151549 RepID=A0A4C1W863_EUMVA|nr:Mitosis initiation protein fs(1)Ya [Eumeta japonica]
MLNPLVSKASCIECPLTFCCANCRRKHEREVHGLEFECPLCRHRKFLCEPSMISNSKFLAHVVKKHLPLHCEKCDRYFTKMEDFVNIDKCVTVSELVTNGERVKGEANGDEVNEKFELLYVNSKGTNEDNQNEGENFEAIVSVDKSNRTAVITPIMRQKYLVDYDTSGSSEAEDITSPKSAKIEGTPYPKVASKTPRSKRTATPHVRKFLLRQRVVEEEDERVDHNHNAMDGSPKSNEVIKNNEGVFIDTPSRENDDQQLLKQSNEVTTPTSHLVSDLCAKIGSTVTTTSTPTHPVTGTWAIFPEQGADSPLSEIEGTTGESPAQSVDNEPLKSDYSDSALPKLKSIIVTNSKLRLESQDSSEKQPTFQQSGSSDTSANKTKRVKFAEDTVFEQDRGPNRIFRKPKRVLTPGPQKPRFCFNPRFQALINRFENQGKTMARTPNVVRFSSPNDGTPAVGDNAVCPVRAIDFKDDSAVAEHEKSSAIDKDSTGNELFKSCVDSPKENEKVDENNALSKVISALANNIAGSLETCLVSALRSAEDHTEIQFKFVITERKVSVKRITDHGLGADVKTTEVDRATESNKENIWSAVARAVKKVFWGDENESKGLGLNYIEGFLCILKCLHLMFYGNRSFTVTPLPSTVRVDGRRYELWCSPPPAGVPQRVAASPAGRGRGPPSTPGRAQLRGEFSILNSAAVRLRRRFGMAQNTAADDLLNLYESESSSKRKYSEMLESQMSPVNRKRHRFEGRIRGRPPLPRTGRPVSKLKTSFSGDSNSFLKEWSKKEDTVNQSF